MDAYDREFAWEQVADHAVDDRQRPADGDAGEGTDGEELPVVGHEQREDARPLP
jgi:hypothetical protein